MDEFAGFEVGCNEVMTDKEWCKGAMGRTQILANMPGSGSDIVPLLLDELNLMKEKPAQIVEIEEILAKSPYKHTVQSLVKEINWPLAQCSMFGAWGSRTENGDLFSGRNLDWNQNSGINKNKLIAIHHPPQTEGKDLVAHVTLGFAGIYGSLAGMSEKGLTVHEANLESNKDTFKGFPWLIRLRYIMEYATNLEEAKTLWSATNNTVGFNHMVGSASDKDAIVMETHANHTSYFKANSPIEAASVVHDTWGNKTYTYAGAPMTEAIYRTNHGFAPETLETYTWNGTHAYHDSNFRYHLVHDSIANYETHKTMIGPKQAVNIISLLGQKGPDYTKCAIPYHDGSNVLSVAYAPADQVVYAAWEDGQDATWVPAACSPYVAIDLKDWFNKPQLYLN